MKFNILPGGTVKRKSHVLRNSIILFCSVLFLSAVTFFICRLIDIHVYKGNSITHLSKEWKNFNYQKVCPNRIHILPLTRNKTNKRTYTQL